MVKKAVLFKTQETIETLMKLLDLPLREHPPRLHDLHHMQANRLVTYVEKVSHGLPPLPSVVLALLGLIPVPLRFPLRAPCRIASAMALGALWADVTIRVSRPPDHAVAQMPFCDIDVEPAVCP
jgi:hypothetical protein